MSDKKTENERTTTLKPKVFICYCDELPDGVRCGNCLLSVANQPNTIYNDTDRPTTNLERTEE